MTGPQKPTSKDQTWAGMWKTRVQKEKNNLSYFIYMKYWLIDEWIPILDNTHAMLPIQQGIIYYTAMVQRHWTVKNGPANTKYDHFCGPFGTPNLDIILLQGGNPLRWWSHILIAGEKQFISKKTHFYGTSELL